MEPYLFEEDLAASCIRVSLRSVHAFTRVYAVIMQDKCFAVTNFVGAQSVFALYFPDRPIHSDTISASLGSIQPYATINARRLLLHISTTVYNQVLIYTAG